jgi:hypothetical protein
VQRENFTFILAIDILELALTSWAGKHEEKNLPFISPFFIFVNA